MTRYIVTAPPYEREAAPSSYLPDWGRPMETRVDYWEGEADNPKQAKVLAVRFWRKEHRQNWRECWHVGDADSDGRCPFTGLKVEIYPTAEEATESAD